MWSFPTVRCPIAILWNFSANETRRVDMSVDVAYGSDLKAAKSTDREHFIRGMIRF